MSRRLAHDSSEYASLHSLYPIQCRVEPRVQLKVHPASRYPSVAPVWLVFYKRLCTHPPFRSLVLALPEVRVAFYHTLAPSHTSAFCSVMPSGTVATVPGSGADAPRSVWAGIIFVRIFPLLPRVSPNSDHRPPRRPSSLHLAVSSLVMTPVPSPVSRLWGTGCVPSVNPIPSPGCAPSPHPSRPSSSPHCPSAPSSELFSPPLLQISTVGGGPSSSLSSSSLPVLPRKSLHPLFLTSSQVVSSPVGVSEWFPC